MVVEENKIDYEQVIMMIKEGIANIIENDDMGTYDKLDVCISNEQFFIKQKKEGLYPNTIYMVVKFGSSTVDYGVTVLPLTIIAMSEQNHCNLCQRLLQDFATTANMGYNNTESIQQFYESPAVTSNFNEMYEGFRSVLTVPGSFVISESSNPFTLEWYNPSTYIDENDTEQIIGWQDVYFITGDIEANFQTDPKLFYSSNNYTRSINTMGTVTFNISSVLLSDGAFYDKMLDFIAKKNNYEIDLDPSHTSTYLKRVAKAEPDGVNVNNDLVFRIKFKKSNQTLIDIFKIADIKVQQVLKKIPMTTMVFTN